MQIKPTSVLAAGLLTMISHAASAANPVTVSDDTFVQPLGYPTSDTADINYGTNASLLVKNTSNGENTRIVFLKFDLSQETGTFSSTDGLNIAVNQQNGTSQIEQFEIWGLKTQASWTETDLTWNTANSDVVSMGEDYTDQAYYGINPAEADLLDVCNAPAGTPTFEIFCDSPDLLAYMDANVGESEVTLIIRRNDTSVGSNLSFASKEATGGENSEARYYIPAFGPQGYFARSSAQTMPVPSLPIWGLLSLSALLAAFGVRRIQR